MTDKIREAYIEAVAKDRHVCNEHSFIAGWQAALSSLEQVGWAKANGDAVYLDKPDEVFQYDPLYRIKDPKP